MKVAYKIFPKTSELVAAVTRPDATRMMLYFRFAFLTLLVVRASSLELSEAVTETRITDDKDFDEVVNTLIQKVPGVFERKSLSFFSHFGDNLNRNKIGGRVNCQYGDPNQKNCPPVSQMNPYLFYSGTESRFINLNKMKEGEIVQHVDVESLTKNVHQDSGMKLSEHIFSF